MKNRNEIYKRLSSVIHPEYKSDIVSLEIVKSYSEDENRIEILLLFKRKNDPMASSVRKLTELAVKDIVKNRKEVVVSVVPDETPVNKEYNALENVKHVVAIASGKGGVGKSTVAVNLAVALAKKGYKIGLLDADIYGPSLPIMFGLEGYRPDICQINRKDLMLPPEKFGVKVMSIGFFFDPSKALIWRGPMATSAIKNLLNDTCWGELDFLLIDLPPGTNDIHLTLVQTIGLSAAVVVTTPQMVAVADAIKAVNMFQDEKINIPVIGIVENMAWFSPDDLPENKYYVFGKGGAQYISDKMNVPLIGNIPVSEKICSGGDSGNPAFMLDDPIIKIELDKITGRFLEELEKSAAVHKPQKVEIKPQK